MFHIYLELAAKVVCVTILMFQGGILDLYLIKMNNMYWIAWISADIVVIAVWSVTLYLAHRHFKKRRDRVDGRPAEDYPDELRFVYIAWLAYATFLAPRVVLLFRKYAQKLDENDVFGPNFLKMAAACTPIVFFLLVSGHHDSRPHSERRYYLDKLTGSVALDLFDSMDLLEAAFEDSTIRKFPEAVLNAAIAFACIMLFLPGLALIELRVNKFNGQVSPLPFRVMYSACFVFLVNVPNLIIRSVLWHSYNSDVSVLLMKNVLCTVLGLLEIYDFLGNEGPKKCPRCEKFFAKTHFGNHSSICGNQQTELKETNVDTAHLTKV